MYREVLDLLILDCTKFIGISAMHFVQKRVSLGAWRRIIRLQEMTEGILSFIGFFVEDFRA